MQFINIINQVILVGLIITALSVVADYVKIAAFHRIRGFNLIQCALQHKALDVLIKIVLFT
jgi:hypothetical protein